MKVGQKFGDLLVGGYTSRRNSGRIDLDAIAGRQHYRFDRRKPCPSELAHRRLLGAEGQTATHFDTRRMMAQAAHLVLHAAPPPAAVRAVREQNRVPLLACAAVPESIARHRPRIRI